MNSILLLLYIIEEATGSMASFPYKRLHGSEVEGLPKVSFKKRRAYGASQLKSILLSKDNIKIRIKDTDSTSSADATDHSSSSSTSLPPLPPPHSIPSLPSSFLHISSSLNSPPHHASSFPSPFVFRIIWVGSWTYIGVD